MFVINHNSNSNSKIWNYRMENVNLLILDVIYLPCGVLDPSIVGGPGVVCTPSHSLSHSLMGT